MCVCFFDVLALCIISGVLLRPLHSSSGDSELQAACVHVMQIALERPLVIIGFSGWARKARASDCAFQSHPVCLRQDKTPGIFPSIPV